MAESLKLAEIREAIARGEIERARELLRDELADPSADAYYLASQVPLNDAQRVQFLEKALELDPFHQDAADELGRIQQDQEARQEFDPPDTPGIASAALTGVGEGVSQPIDTSPDKRRMARSRRVMKPALKLGLYLLPMLILAAITIAQFVTIQDLEGDVRRLSRKLAGIPTPLPTAKPTKAPTPIPKGYTVMPDLAGMRFKEAAKMLSETGFVDVSAEFVEVDTNLGMVPGLVNRQNPQGEKVVSLSEKVRLWITAEIIDLDVAKGDEFFVGTGRWYKVESPIMGYFGLECPGVGEGGTDIEIHCAWTQGCVEIFTIDVSGSCTVLESHGGATVREIRVSGN